MDWSNTSGSHVFRDGSSPQALGISRGAQQVSRFNQAFQLIRGNHGHVAAGAAAKKPIASRG
ncbi:MAG: hypothetical protein IPN92_04265 [Chromatiaceae bacterium]|nr:hypothetical protein [Chromatiaceae bacterium]